MEQYFQDVMNDLTIEDMSVLGILFDREATAGFKAIKNNEVVTLTGLSEATFRKVAYRLIANKFISIVTQKRHHSIYITQYGVLALKESLEGVKT